MENKNIYKMGIVALTTFVISSMIGGGIFSLPQNMASEASVGAIIISWLITGLGIFFIANTFIILSRIKPELNSGIYMYARDGFGPYIGFTIGWGYWLCNSFSNIGLAVMAMNALDYFFPGVFTGGNNIESIICISILIWSLNFLVLNGVKQTAFLNIIATITKILPLILFILIMLFVFKFDNFTFNFWGNITIEGYKLGSLTEQIKSTMMVTLWTFIGIETAIVLSTRAKTKKIVSRSTLFGFLICLIIYMLLSILPFGFLSQSELANIPDPSTAGILEKVIGKTGSYIMNIGVLIAVLSCCLSWTLILVETPTAMAENGTFPKIFEKKNKNGIPYISSYTTTIIIQICILMIYFADNAWKMIVNITGVMVLPAYFTSTLYLIKISLNHEYSKRLPITRTQTFITGFFGCAFTIWLIYSAGLNYLALAAIFFTLGIPMFIWAKKQSNLNEKIFTFKEKFIVLILIISSLISIASLFF